MGAKIIIGIAGLAILIQLLTGATIMNVRGQYGMNTTVIRRSEQPGTYWGSIGFQFFVILICVLYLRGIVH